MRAHDSGKAADRVETAELEVDPPEIQVLDRVRARGSERDPQPWTLLLSQQDDHGTYGQPDRDVGDEVDKLEVQLSEHAV
jgi:hypothetical protein